MTTEEFCEQQLTPHGKKSATRVGEYYRDVLERSDATRDGHFDFSCDTLAIFADNSTRDIQTATQFLTGFGCVEATPLLLRVRRISPRRCGRPSMTIRISSSVPPPPKTKLWVKLGTIRPSWPRLLPGVSTWSRRSYSGWKIMRMPRSVPKQIRPTTKTSTGPVLCFKQDLIIPACTFKVISWHRKCY